MNDDEQLEELIREIAKRHGLIVSRDDPILVLQTVNNRLLLDSSRAQQAMLDRYKQEVEALAAQWGRDATQKAERVLDVALTASKDAIEGILEKASQTSLENFQREVDAVAAHLNAALGGAHTVAALNVLAGCMTVLGAAIIWWMRCF